MTRAPSIAVIGGGIGGLAAALSLRRAGFEVDVYEQAPEPTMIGGGINMGANAARILNRLGLGDGLDREAVRPLSRHQRRSDDGRTLQYALVNPRCEELYGAPHLAVHRADLLAVMQAALPPETIHLGHRLVAFRERGGRVEAGFANGAAIAADVLIGADGIHSTVRALLFGDEVPQFAGCVAYRALVPVERIADLGLERGNQSWVGPGAHLVHHPVSRGRLLNFVGWTEHDSWNREDWTDRATVERALAACLAAGADPAAALRRYQRLRLPRVTRLQQMSRANKLRFHMRDGPEQQARDAEWARQPERASEALQWLYGFDAGVLPPEPATAPAS